MSIILYDNFNFVLYEHRDKEAGFSLLQTSEQRYQAA